MVKTKEELLAEINDIVGDVNTDEYLALLEDLSDTLDSVQSSTEWEKKLKDLDETWREKYKARFFDGDTEHEVEHEGDTHIASYDYDDLFEEGE